LTLSDGYCAVVLSGGNVRQHVTELANYLASKVGAEWIEAADGNIS
jgi:hypothetical protein